MNRQDALEKAIHYSKVYHSICDDAEGFWAAVIEALSQEPCRYWKNGKCNGNTEVCDDAVSREDALNSLIENTDFEGWELSQALEAIEKLPTVTQKPETVTEFADRCRECGAKYGKLLEQRSGKWIVHPKGIYAHLVCDKCLSRAPYDCRTNYCPNCGAKMESEVRNET